MIKTIVSNCFLWILLLCACALSACSFKHVDLQTEEHDRLLRQDIAQIKSVYPQDAQKNADIEPASGLMKLTLKEALNRGVLYNLDARVAAMEVLVQKGDISIEGLKALPSVKASGSFVGRTNDGGTSSLSVLSGQQSLEPSQSTEENRRTAEIELTWNLIDAALAISESRTAKEEAQISQKRHMKVVQNIQRDVYSAYWRALVNQQYGEQTASLIQQVDDYIKKLEEAQKGKLLSSDAASDKIAALSKQREELASIQNQMALSEIELKSLLSLPLDEEIILDDDTGEFDKKYNEFLTADITDLEWEALKSRPEVEEEILKKNISWRNTRHEIIKTFPGMEVFLAGHYDDNKFIEDVNWGNYSAKIMQSVNSLISAPFRYRKAKNEEFLADARRQALVLAVMAQTRIARHRLEFASNQYNSSNDRKIAADRKAFSVQKKHLSGFQSGEDLLSAQIEKQINALQAGAAEAQMQDAYAAFANTLGREISSATAIASADKVTGGRS